jgi:hypothetical protein
MGDLGCAQCQRPRRPGEPTNYGAYWYHLGEPDWVCDDCANGKRSYVSADFTGPQGRASRN